MNSSFFLGSVAAAVGFFMLFTKFRFQQEQDNKDTKSSSLFLPSPLTSVSRIWKHHVFPSFHGADVRKTFLSHILESFRRKGIDPFIDSDIERSKSIGPELIEAIRGSKIAIVLLSRKYASSSWCLDELVEIMKSREELSQIVMTIFYEVDPTKVKKQTGDFGKAFRKTCKGKTKEHIERWRKALEDVAKIAGEHSRNWGNEAGNEAAMIEKIATDISNMLNNSTPSRDFDGLVGMRAHMERMERLLRLDLDEVRMIGIWGPPGIGKTTIARVLFNQVSNRFQLGAFMVDIKGCYPRPCLDEYNAQLQLQKRMLSQIINQKDIMISHLGVAKERLKDKKVFLVLDDVDLLGQLYALAKEIHWFGPGSRIIITTEDLRVLNAHRINHIYKVKFPSSDEAFQIFCMHAFGKKHPDDGFGELAKEVTYLAGELPLGLKVLGSALRGMSKQEWKKILPCLKTRLDGEIKSIIKFSYDALCDEDKYLFLYIACLFNHRKTHEVEEVLANNLSNVRQCLHVLAKRSLISINRDLDVEELIEMHTLLEQFGRETSREQFVHGIAKHQLLVDSRDIREVLSGDTIDSRRFIGINLDLSETKEELNISEKTLERMSDLQFIKIYNPERLHSVPQGLICHSQKIRSLQWENFQNICLPSTFNTEFLVKLDMSFNKLQKLWEGTKPLRNLKWMDLRFSEDLKELPDLSTATNLEELNLNFCSSLVELPFSIGKLTSLHILDLRECSSLVKIPSSIKNATNLQRLHLSHCSNLVEHPSIGNATKLEELNLDNCSSLVKLPSINATNLQILDLYNCSSLVELPAIENVTNLRILELNNCSSLLKLPPSIGTATNLEILDISGCSSLVKLPDSIGDITNLKVFNPSDCSSLIELHASIGTATNLEKLDMSGCSSLVKLPGSIGDITNLKVLNLSDCSNLQELPPSIGTATNLEKLDISGCSSLVKLPNSIGDITNLEVFNLSDCSSLLELPPFIRTATNLEKLDISGCSSLVKLPDSIGDITNLEVFNLYDCSSLIELPPFIGTATNLEKLDISGCSRLVKLPNSIGDITNLEVFNLSDCSSLIELPPFIGTATNLEKLDISGCSSLVKLPDSIGDITNLEVFNLYDCSSLLELPPFIGTAKNLEKLDISRCSSLVKLPDSIGDIANLEVFNLSDCSSLLELPPFVGTTTNLEKLDISGCSSLVKLPDSIGNITNLQYFNLSNCSSLVELPSSIGNLQKLWKLMMCGCSNLEALPTNINLKSLYRLDLTDCSQLKSFPQISTNIRDLNLTGTAIKEVPLSIMSWSCLSDFHMSYYESLKEFPHAHDVITELHLVSEDIQEIAPWVKGLSQLRVLRLYNCNNLVSLPQFSDSLSHIVADNCKSLEKLDCSFNNPKIRLNFTNCFSLNQEARDLIMHTSTPGYAILPNTQVPACFSHRATA